MVEFYKLLRQDIKVILHNSINAVFDSGEMPITQNHGVIIILPKKGKDLLLNNWRPIFFLNHDYKLTSKCVANRITCS